jgi:putative acetyltransferase
MLSIAQESPRQPEVLTLFEQSDAYAASLYPQEGHYPVDADYLSVPHVRFLVARWQGAAVGCCALVMGADHIAELKRMIVDPAARGRGIGRGLMAAIEEVAMTEGIRLIQLETGPANGPALALYRACGYQERGRFGMYEPSPYSLFMERVLVPS